MCYLGGVGVVNTCSAYHDTTLAAASLIYDYVPLITHPSGAARHLPYVAQRKPAYNRALVKEQKRWHMLDLVPQRHICACCDYAWQSDALLLRAVPLPWHHAIKLL
jgi:hypothetical protein